MKSTLVLSLLALLLCAAGLVTSLVNLKAAGNPTASEPAEEALHPEDDLRLRLKRLEEENGRLSDRLATLERLPVAPARQPVTEESLPREEFEAFREEIAAALASRGPFGSETPQETLLCKEQIADTLAEIRLEETQQAIQKKIDGRLEGLDETMPKLERWLQLTPQQSEQLRSVLLARYEREAELVRRWKEGEDPDVLGELKTSDLELHRAELARILSPHQLETYRGGGK